jgi:ribosomal protein S19
MFWISDENACAEDVNRLSNMRVLVARSYNGEDVLKSIFPVTQTILREQFVNPSLLTLFISLKKGIHCGHQFQTVTIKAKMVVTLILKL